MRLNVLILIVACLAPFAIMAFMQEKSPAQPVEPKAAANAITTAPVPAFSFVDRSGGNRSIEDFRGGIVILNFWATWCAPCLAEFPKLLALAAAHEGKVYLLSLSVDEEPEKIGPFLSRLDTLAQSQLTLDNVIIGYDTDKKISQDIFQTFRLPETIIIDKSGAPRHKIVGGVWDVQDVEKIIRDILEE